MKIILINKYLYPKGGDARITIDTGNLLSRMGHEVIYWGMEAPENPVFPFRKYFVSHVDYNQPSSLFRQFKLLLNILYSLEARDKIDALLKKVRPDIVHLGNFAHQISPSILNVFKEHNIPMVMTLHDYKMVCASYQMLAGGKPCENCRNGRYYWCLIQKCTKRSYTKSLLNTIEMYLHHKVLHIYDLIDICIPSSQFMEEKLKKMGFRNKMVRLPNFLDVNKYEPQYEWRDRTICYFGRVSEEKGIITLIEAMKGLDLKLKIIGDGPIKESLQAKVKTEKMTNIIFLGFRSGKELEHEIRNSMIVVLPSIWYENYPRSVIEAFALGKPVIGARIGGIPELVRDSETGLTFEPGNAADLRGTILSLLKARGKIVEMGKTARAFVEEELNPEKHYQVLMQIYMEAINRCSIRK